MVFWQNFIFLHFHLFSDIENMLFLWKTGYFHRFLVILGDFFGNSESLLSQITFKHFAPT